MTKESFYEKLNCEKGQEYLKLIEDSKNSPLKEDQSYEKHHVWPKGLGGPVDGETVHLSSKSHLIAHKLLAEIFGGKMLYAFNQMINTRGSQGTVLQEDLEKIAKLREESIKESTNWRRAHKVWEKSRKTMLERYGVPCPPNFHSQEAEAKRTATKVSRYGSKMGHLLTPEVKEKRRRSALEDKEYKRGMFSEEARKKGTENRVKVMIEKYGNTWSQLQRPEVRKKASEKMVQTCREKYGNVTARTRTPEALARSKNTKELTNLVTLTEDFLTWYFQTGGKKPSKYISAAKIFIKQVKKLTWVGEYWNIRGDLADYEKYRKLNDTERARVRHSILDKLGIVEYALRK